MGSDEFLRDYFGKSFLYLPGNNGKFGSLLPWNELNRILEEHRLVPPRLTLFQGGKSIPTEKYLCTTDRYGPRLLAAELTNLLAQGATLVVNTFDELHKPIRELAVGLERIVRTTVWVNLYAGWRTDRGFLLHYDDHDTVILQVAGRKHWAVYRPTRLSPLEQGKDVEPAEKPVEEPIWNKILEDGGLLYIPRGWWHVANPVDEPTLHLTISIQNHRGLDLLIWLVKQLKNCLEVRQDIPHLADRDRQLVYMEQLRKYLFEAWSDDLLERFLASTDANALLRPHLQLPNSATPQGIVLNRKSLVRLTGARRLDLTGKPQNSNLKFKCSGKTLHCSVATLPALERVNDGESHSVQELLDLVPTQETNVLNFLQLLVLQGNLTTGPEDAEKLAQGQGRTQ